LVLFSSVFVVTGVTFADEHLVGMPHSITVRLEPSYVNVGDSVKIIATFIPCVDVESLQVRLWLPAEFVGKENPVLIRELRSKAKKGEEIVISGRGVAPKAGLYDVQVSYLHRDPKWPRALNADVLDFPISIPGGRVPARRVEDELPYRLKEAPEGIGDKLGGGQLLHFPAGGKTSSARDSMFTKCPRVARADSITTVFVTLPSAGGTVWVGHDHIIATCEAIYGLGGPGSYWNLDWHVKPASMGTAEELQDHRVKFRAGSTGGVCVLGGDTGDIPPITYAFTIEIIANYQLNGTWQYQGRRSGEYLPWIGSVVRLYTVDSQSNDLVDSCYNQEFHYRLVDSTYTDTTGYYEFNGLNVDSIEVGVYTKCPSHEVGQVSGGYWRRYGSGYCDFGIEYCMDWMDPVCSEGVWVYTGTYRGARNIMSFAYKGVNYVTHLPDSHFPEKVIFSWNITSADTVTGYFHQGITFGGQTYDLIRVGGYGDRSDEWDEDVFLHEYGHFVMDNYAALPPVIPSCGPGHSWRWQSSPECAYTEGWAWLFSGACQKGDPVYFNSWSDTTAAVIDLELPTYDPQGDSTEGAVAASFWDIFDFHNDRDTLDMGIWYHNRDWNAGLLWQRINEIWWALGQPGDLGHYPRTVCEFQHIWGWSGYPIDYLLCSIFFAHGIQCAECDPVGIADELASVTSPGPFLWPNYPNPFNPVTEIAFRVGVPGIVSLRIFNASGQLVRTLLRSPKDPGTYRIWWDSKDDCGRFLASGVYFCHLVAGSFRQIRKLVILR
jgi:hypothetical protein